MRLKKIKVLLIIIGIIAIMAFCFGGCRLIYLQDWEHLKEIYTEEESRFVYQSFNGTIVNADEIINKKAKEGFRVTVDTEDYLERYGEVPKAETELAYYRTHGYFFADESIAILEEAGFFDAITAETVITFTVNNYIGWDGWAYPVFGVEVNGKTYLDFDTGYANVLSYIQRQIDKNSLW